MNIKIAQLQAKPFTVKGSLKKFEEDLYCVARYGKT
jgi:hypothetical protein